MPRSGGRSSGGRSSAPSRSASSSTRQPAPQQPPAQRPQQGGVPAQQAPSSAGSSWLGQVASTAMGVTAGHGISNALFGGSGGGSAPAQQDTPVQSQTFDQQAMGGACTIQARDFTKCLDATNNDMSSCSYYLDMLKACQSAAAPY